MSHSTPRLETARFDLRPLERGDTAALFPTFADATQCRYLTRPAFADEAELEGWLFDPDWDGRTWIAIDRTSGAVAGRFVAVPGHDDGVAEIGYVVVMEGQGQGVARECTAALVSQLFAEGHRKVIAEVDSENVASIRLLGSLGFIREARFRQHETTHIGLRDVEMWGVLKGEWTAAS